MGDRSLAAGRKVRADYVDVAMWSKSAQLETANRVHVAESGRTIARTGSSRSKEIVFSKARSYGKLDSEMKELGSWKS